MPHNRSSILVADYDRDGKLDLYLTRNGPPGNLSWLQGRSDDAKGNRLFRNLGDWKFEDVTKKSGTRGGYRSTFTAAWLDANDDGWPDLHVPNEFGDGVLLLNQRRRHVHAHALADRPADFGTMGLAVGDVDNDGRIDIYCANMYSKAGTRRDRQHEAGRLSTEGDGQVPPVRRRQPTAPEHGRRQVRAGRRGEATRLGRLGLRTALADLDGDGFLDVYATAGYISRDRSKPDG